MHFAPRPLLGPSKGLSCVKTKIMVPFPGKSFINILRVKGLISMLAVFLLMNHLHVISLHIRFLCVTCCVKLLNLLVPGCLDKLAL